jgi:hypothetical protein
MSKNNESPNINNSLSFALILLIIITQNLNRLKGSHTKFNSFNTKSKGT